jgi:cardiolipin synthase
MFHWPPRKSDIPNILTISRLVILPFMIVLFLIHQPWAAWSVLFLYIPAAISDYFDGYFARLYNNASFIGVFLDPIADKLFVGAILFMLAATGRLEDWWGVPALLIMMREILIAGLREFLGNKQIKMPVTRLAKWKTGFQMTCIGFLIMWPYVNPHWFSYIVEVIGKVTLLAACALTVKTGWDYTKTAWPTLRETANSNND